MKGITEKVSPHFKDIMIKLNMLIHSSSPPIVTVIGIVLVDVDVDA